MPGQRLGFSSHLSYLLSCLFGVLSIFLGCFFIRKYAYVDHLIFGSVNFETHHHPMLQIKTLYHEAGHTCFIISLVKVCLTPLAYIDFYLRGFRR